MAPKHRRLLWILAGLLCLAAGVTLILYNFRANMVFFYSPAVLKNQAVTSNRAMRIGGLIKEHSVHKSADKLTTFFVITDLQADIDVEYTGLLPALFREGQGMVVTGKLGKNGVFIASELLAKHDENYMPKDVADTLKKSGRWHPDGEPKK